MDRRNFLLTSGLALPAAVVASKISLAQCLTPEVVDPQFRMFEVAGQEFFALYSVSGGLQNTAVAYVTRGSKAICIAFSPDRLHHFLGVRTMETRTEAYQNLRKSVLNKAAALWPEHFEEIVDGGPLPAKRHYLNQLLA